MIRIAALAAAAAWGLGGGPIKPAPKGKRGGNAKSVKTEKSPVKTPVKTPAAALPLDTLHPSAQLQTDTAGKPRDSLVIIPGKVIASLAQATGYIKSNNGKWHSSPNRIPYDDPDYNNPLYDKFRLGTENFKNFTMREARVNGKLYWLLTMEHVKGYYKDKEETNFQYYNSADYYFIDSAAISKLLPDSIVYGKPYSVSLRSDYSGTVNWFYNPKEMLAAIRRQANANYNTRLLYDTTMRTYLQFQIKPIKNKKGKHIRFNTMLAYAHSAARPVENNFMAFDYQFYELPLDQFRKFGRFGKP